MNSAAVIPAKAGIHVHATRSVCAKLMASFGSFVILDSRLRGKDGRGGTNGAL
jgi:hypothetical protein